MNPIIQHKLLRNAITTEVIRLTKNMRKARTKREKEKLARDIQTLRDMRDGGQPYPTHN